MKKKGLLVLAALALAPTIVKADMDGPATIPYYISPIKDSVTCEGYDNKTGEDITVNLDKNEIYIVRDVYDEDKTRIIFNDDINCLVRNDDVKTVKLYENKISEKKYEGVVVANGGLNLREGPSTSFKKLITIPRMTKIQYQVYTGDSFSESDGPFSWVYVEYNGQAGWVYLDGNDEKTTVANFVENDERLGSDGKVYKDFYQNAYYGDRFSDICLIKEQKVKCMQGYYKAKDDIYYRTYNSPTEIVSDLLDENAKVLGTVPGNTLVKILYYFDYNTATLYVEYNGIKGFLKNDDWEMIITNKEETKSYNLYQNSFNTDNEEIDFTELKNIKSQYASLSEYDHYKVEEYKETSTTEVSNKKTQHTTLKEQITKDNNMVIYSIVGVVVGVLTTIIVMLLINKKNKNRDASTIEIKNTDTRNISVEEIPQEKEEKIEEKDV